MGFKYKRRSAQSIEKRANQRGGEFVSFISDEFKMYKMRSGDNAIRVLPPTWEDPENYAYDIWTHFSVGPDKATILCPNKMEGKKCPVCQEAMRLQRNGDEDEAKQLAPKRRCLAWVIDRKDEQQGPLAMAMPWTVDKDIAKISRDKRTGELYYIDDPDEGYDVYFDKEGEKRNTTYNGFQLAKRPSEVHSKFLKFVQDHPIPSILVHHTYDEIKALFEGGMSDDDEDDDDKKSKSRRKKDEDKPRSRRDRLRDDDDEDEDEKPARRRSRRDEDEDEDDEDEKPARRRSRRDDDDDEDDEEEKPKRSSRRRPSDDDDEDEEEDEKPKRFSKRRSSDDDDDEDDEEEEPKAKLRRRPLRGDDDEDEEEEKPKRKRDLRDEINDEIPFTGSKKIKKRAEPEEDDEDEDDEEETKPVRRRPTKKAAEPEDDDDEEEDDEKPAPKTKTSALKAAYKARGK